MTNANMIASWRSLSNARAEIEPRRRTLKGAVAYNYGMGIDCPIRNLRGHGACLEIESPAGIPNVFTLTRQDYQHGDGV